MLGCPGYLGYILSEMTLIHLARTVLLPVAAKSVWVFFRIPGDEAPARRGSFPFRVGYAY